MLKAIKTFAGAEGFIHRNDLFTASNHARKAQLIADGFAYEVKGSGSADILGEVKETRKKKRGAKPIDEYEIKGV